MATLVKRLIRSVAVVLLVSASVATLAGEARAFSGGSGTSGDPYQLGSCADLQAIGSYMTSSYVLSSDISCLGTSFTPIGRATWTKFSGSINGAGHTISDMSITCAAYYCGMFYHLYSGTISNLTFTDATVTSSADHVGILAADAGYLGNKVTVNSVTVRSSSVSGTGTVGALIGTCQACLISNSTLASTVTVTGTSNYIGGFIGEVYAYNTSSQTAVSDSTSAATVNGRQSTGGIIGQFGRDNYLANSGVIRTSSSGPVTGTDYVGGLVGTMTGNTAPGINIENSFSTSNVAGNTRSGGLVGWNRGGSGRIYRSYATGSVTLPAGASNCGAGGLVGMDDNPLQMTHFSITQSYSTSTITAQCQYGGIVGNSSHNVSAGYATDISDSFFRGRLVARASSTDSGGLVGRGIAHVSKSYAAVTATQTAGAGVADNVTYPAVCTDTYWDSTTSGIVSTQCGATGKSTADMKTQSTFTGWDFSSTWSIAAGANNGYPYLFNVGGPATDSEPPTATWSGPSTPSASRTLSYTVTFSESVTGIAAGDFSAGGTATGCVFTPSAAGGSSVSVSVTCASDGTVIARLSANSIVDSVGNTGPTSTASASTVTIDTVVPTTTTVAPATSAPTTSTPSNSTPAPASSTPSPTVTVSPALVSTVPTNAGAPSTSVVKSPSTASTVSTGSPSASPAGSRPLPAPEPTTTTVVPPSTTLPELDVPEAPVGGAAVSVDGVESVAKVTRENNQVHVEVGPVDARMWGVAASGGQLALDSSGRLRVMPDDSVAASVTGFDAGSTVEVRFYSEPVLLGRTRVGVSGLLEGMYAVPHATENGDHQIVLIGTARGSRVAFSLSVAVGKETGGFNPLIVILPVAVAAIAALLLPVAWRRRRHDEHAAGGR